MYSYFHFLASLKMLSLICIICIASFTYADVGESSYLLSKYKVGLHRSPITLNSTKCFTFILVALSFCNRNLFDFHAKLITINSHPCKNG